MMHSTYHARPRSAVISGCHIGMYRTYLLPFLAPFCSSPYRYAPPGSHLIFLYAYDMLTICLRYADIIFHIASSRHLPYRDHGIYRRLHVVVGGGAVDGHLDAPARGRGVGEDREDQVDLQGPARREGAHQKRKLNELDEEMEARRAALEARLKREAKEAKKRKRMQQGAGALALAGGDAEQREASDHTN